MIQNYSFHHFQLGGSCALYRGWSFCLVIFLYFTCEMESFGIFLPHDRIYSHHALWVVTIYLFQPFPPAEKNIYKKPRPLKNSNGGPLRQWYRRHLTLFCLFRWGFVNAKISKLKQMRKYTSIRDTDPDALQMWGQPGHEALKLFTLGCTGENVPVVCYGYHGLPELIVQAEGWNQPSCRCTGLKILAALALWIYTWAETLHHTCRTLHEIHVL